MLLRLLGHHLLLGLHHTSLVAVSARELGLLLRALLIKALVFIRPLVVILVGVIVHYSNCFV